MKPRPAKKTANPGRKAAAKQPVLIEKLVEQTFATEGEAERFKAALQKFGVSEFVQTKTSKGISLIFRTRRED